MNNNHRRTIFISTPHSDFRQQILSTINVMVNNTSDIQSDTFDDQVGITMRYQISNGGLSYTVIPNSWNQVSSREIRKKEKRIKKLNEQHEANKDIAFNNDD